MPQSGNHLLAVLPALEFLRLQPLLTRVTLAPKTTIWEANQAVQAVHFPLDAVVSIFTATDDGGTVEVGSVGCEGLVGLPVLFGSDCSTSHALVQIGGEAEQMSVAAFRTAVEQSPGLRRLLHLYALAFLSQISQSTACNRLHAAEQRLVRWLLVCRDRVGRDELPVTHESMALTLGVRRATVTEAAGELQRRGLIRYRRGALTILDRAGLEAIACECYSVVRGEFDRLLGVRVG